MARLTLDEYFMQMAELVSRRATCPRRQVGAVLTNRLGHVLATGYNGPPRGTPHCVDVPCPGATLPSGTGLDKCDAVHAEENSLLQCRDVNEIDTAYVTTAPCLPCTRKLLNTSCRRIVFLKPYAASHSDSETKWRAAGREWVHFQPSED